MAQAYNNISFYALYDAPKTAALDDILILNDNFDNPVHQEQPINRGSVPSKMVSNMTVLVCLDGYIEGSNNLKDFRLEKNDVVVNCSRTIGHFYGMSKDVKFLLMIVNTNFYFPTMISGDVSELQGITVKHPVCHLSETTAQATLHIYNILKERLNTEEQPIYMREVARGLAEAFMFNILSSLVKEVRDEERQFRKVSRNEDIYARFLELVEKHYMRERDIKFYADKLCLTPKYLSQIIFKASGSYAGDHIRRFVILEAKALIKSHRYTITQICDMLNFSSQSFFTKYFRNATGMTPTEYQNS